MTHIKKEKKAQNLLDKREFVKSTKHNKPSQMGVMTIKPGSLLKLIDIGNSVSDGLGVEVAAVLDHGAGEHERSVLGFFLIFKIGGAEIDTGAALKRHEECGCHVSTNPIGDPIKLIA